MKNHLDGSAFAATVKKTQKKLLPRDEVTTQHFEDGSTFQGQTSKFGVFEGHGTYEIGSNGDAYTGDFLHGRFHDMDISGTQMMMYLMGNLSMV